MENSTNKKFVEVVAVFPPFRSEFCKDKKRTKMPFWFCPEANNAKGHHSRCGARCWGFWGGFRDGFVCLARMIVGGERGWRSRRRKLLTLRVLGGVGDPTALYSTHIAALQTSQLDVESLGQSGCLHLSYNQSLTIICFSRRSLGVVSWVAASSGGGGICIQLYWRLSTGIPYFVAF